VLVLVHDVHFCTAEGIVVERIEPDAHDHLLDLLAINLCVSIVDPVFGKLLNTVVRQIGSLGRFLQRDTCWNAQFL
jgi:hypothetical protein